MMEAAPGKVRDYAGQQYDCVAIEPYTRRRDGASSYLAVWRSKCAQCGAPVQLPLTAASSAFSTESAVLEAQPAGHARYSVGNSNCPLRRQAPGSYGAHHSGGRSTPAAAPMTCRSAASFTKLCLASG